MNSPCRQICRCRFARGVNVQITTVLELCEQVFQVVDDVAEGFSAERLVSSTIDKLGKPLMPQADVRAEFA